MHVFALAELTLLLAQRVPVKNLMLLNRQRIRATFGNIITYGCLYYWLCCYGSMVAGEAEVSTLGVTGAKHLAVL